VAGEIDISVGSMMGFLGAILGILASTTRLGLPLWVAVALTLCAGVALGLLNGVLVTFGGVPSIIVTLGMLKILQGATELLMGGAWITHLPQGLRWFGVGRVAGVPFSILLAVAVVLVTILIARRTPLGRRVYAVGSNPQAAAVAGLSIRSVKLFVFALTGLFTALATLVSVPQLSVIESGIGRGFEMLVVTCVVVGGTSIRGGVGTVEGTCLGVILLGIVRTVLIFLGKRLGEEFAQTSTYWEQTIQGGLILFAVLADHMARRRSDEGGAL
jgi:ribose/xylose/arabinose/galactoside ABC-type transport system permease subunit